MINAQRISNLRSGIGQQGGYSDQHLRDRIQSLRQGPSQGPSQHPGGRPSGPSPIPWSAQYETTTGAANREYGQSMSELAAQETGVRQSYGFDDPTNPFSVANSLQRDFSQTQNRTLNNYSAAGQLYSGSLSNQENTDRYGFEQAQDAARRQYAAELAGIGSARTAAQNQLTTTNQQADVDRLQAAISETPDPTTSPQRPQGNRPPSPGPNFKWDPARNHWVKK